MHTATVSFFSIRNSKSYAGYFCISYRKTANRLTITVSIQKWPQSYWIKQLVAGKFPAHLPLKNNFGTLRNIQSSRN